MICWRSGGAQELREHAQVVVKVHFKGATSKHPGGYIATNTAYYKLHKLQVGWIFVFMDFHGWLAGRRHPITRPLEGRLSIRGGSR